MAYSLFSRSAQMPSPIVWKHKPCSHYCLSEEISADILSSLFDSGLPRCHNGRFSDLQTGIPAPDSGYSPSAACRTYSPVSTDDHSQTDVQPSDSHNSLLFLYVLRNILSAHGLPLSDGLTLPENVLFSSAVSLFLLSFRLPPATRSLL